MEPNNSETNHIVTIKPDLYWTNVIQEIMDHHISARPVSAFWMVFNTVKGHQTKDSMNLS